MRVCVTVCATRVCALAPPSKMAFAAQIRFKVDFISRLLCLKETRALTRAARASTTAKWCGLSKRRKLCRLSVVAMRSTHAHTHAHAHTFSCARAYSPSVRALSAARAPRRVAKHLNRISVHRTHVRARALVARVIGCARATQLKCRRAGGRAAGVLEGNAARVIPVRREHKCMCVCVRNSSQVNSATTAHTQTHATRRGSFNTLELHLKRIMHTIARVVFLHSFRRTAYGHATPTGRSFDALSRPRSADQ